jgi:drug/metabolite transporter (DMT)-like permease
LSAVLFALVVFCWGFTWYAIALQLGSVPPEVSILWRFALAAAVLWAGLALAGRLKRAQPAQHLWFAAMGLSMFGLNFLLVYTATGFIASGIVSVVFTLLTVFNGLNQWLFFRRRPAPRVVIGGLLGTCGVGLLFGEAFLGVAVGPDAALGVLLVLLGTYVFSLGNMLSLRVTRAGIDMPNAIARGMTWGAAFLALFALLRGSEFRLEWTADYLLSLAYLAIPGSIVAFLAYLSLVRRIGADRAAYTSVLFPVVALTVSTFLEGYTWTPWSLAGLPLVLLGNLVIFVPWPRRKAVPKRVMLE